MYIKYKETDYPCKCNIGTQSITYSNLPEDFPETVEGEIILCANDGFVMRTDNTENYLRQVFKDGTLTLTNIPEVEPDEPSEPIETEPTADEVLNVLLGVE